MRVAIQGTHGSFSEAAAQRRLMMSARFSAPYYWAGYVLSGDGRVQLAGPSGK